MKEFVISVLEACFLNCMCVCDSIIMEKIALITNQRFKIVNILGTHPGVLKFGICGCNIMLTFIVDDRNIVRKIDIEDAVIEDPGVHVNAA